MQKANPTAPLKSFPQPLDRVAIALMLLLAVLIGLLVWSGDRSAPKVREFNWQNKQIGAEDTAFILTFSRPMDQTSVESNLKLDPPLPGKISWAGRRMAYTLIMPAPYGTKYQVQLQDAQDRFTAEGKNRAAIQPFLGQFRARDRAFAYIGVEGEEAGRLILYNLTQQQKRVLTAKNLVVMDFKTYPEGDRILFAATERSANPQGALDQKLYTVTTGMYFNSPGKATKEPAKAGQLQLVLDSKDYQNLKFDLSPDGQTIVVQRVNQRNPGDFGLWLLKAGAEPQPLQTQPGGDFLITPDSSALAFAQGQGLALLPLQPQADPLDFLPKFGMVLGFARDGSAAAMVKFNTNYTRSLFLVTNQGIQKEILKTTGSILSAQFDPTKQVLYCLLTELLPGEDYRERPFLAAIDLKTTAIKPLLRLPDGQRDIQINLSPDGLGFLFDQTIAATKEQNGPNSLRTDDGKAIATSRLWLLPVTPPGTTDAPVQLQPEQLPLAGLHPRWLP
ncbi:MAG TPA: Ig-like domain-containing protein [Allocoleopsis sp.]